MAAAKKRLSDPADYPVREWWADMSKLGPHLDTINQDHKAPRRGWGKQLPSDVASECAAKLRGLIQSDKSMEPRKVTVHDNADSFDGAFGGGKRLSCLEGVELHEMLLFVHSGPRSASGSGWLNLNYNLTAISTFVYQGDRAPPRQPRRTVQNLHLEHQKLHPGEFWDKTEAAQSAAEAVDDLAEYLSSPHSMPPVKALELLNVRWMDERGSTWHGDQARADVVQEQVDSLVTSQSDNPVGNMKFGVFPGKQTCADFNAVRQIVGSRFA